MMGEHILLLILLTSCTSHYDCMPLKKVQKQISISEVKLFCLPQHNGKKINTELWIKKKIMHLSMSGSTHLKTTCISKKASSNCFLNHLEKAWHLVKYSQIALVTKPRSWKWEQIVGWKAREWDRAVINKQ